MSPYIVNGSSIERVIRPWKNVGNQTFCCRARFDVERIEAVERAENAERQLAAFLRIGVGIRKMRIIGGKGRIAVHGDGV